MPMDKKKYAKRYVLSLFGLYMFGAVFLFLIAFFLNRSYDVDSPLSIYQIILISLLFPLLPCASFSGFCNAFFRIKEFSRPWKIAIIVFFPITLVLITLYGFIMIIPSIIKNISVIIKN